VDENATYYIIYNKGAAQGYQKKEGEVVGVHISIKPYPPS
jgi:hypothetical protein